MDIPAVEKYLLKIHQHKDRFDPFLFSCTIYFEDIGNQFVVLLEVMGEEPRKCKHFRNVSLTTSLEQALTWVEGYQVGVTEFENGVK